MTPNNITLFLVIITLISCGERHSKLTQIAEFDETEFLETTTFTPDTLALAKAFDDLRHNEKFINEMLMDDGYAEMGRIDDEIIFGDLNGDGVTDALIPYMVHSRGGGNNWTIHYAIFLGGEKDLWNYVGPFNSGGSASDYYVVLEKIENAKVSGYHTPDRNSNFRDSDVPVKYIYQDGDLFITFLKLHKTEDSYSDYLYIEAIQTSKNQNITTLGTVEDYQRFLGEKEVEWPESEPAECGPYYDYEDFAGFIYYPFLTLEINEINEAAVVFIDLKRSDYNIQTNKGTITGKTQLNEFLSIFGDQIEITRSDSDANEIIDLRVPIDRYNAKDMWVLYLNPDEKTLQSIELVMGCE